MEDKHLGSHWILMADVVDSAGFNEITLQQNLKGAVAYINSKFAKNILSPLTITLGDEFQAVIKNLSKGIDIIFELEEYILIKKLAFQLRYVFLNGKINTPINSEIAYGMLGEGLSEARKTIESLKKSEHRYHIQTLKNKQSEAITKAFIVYQHILETWSSESEKDIVSLFLQNYDYKAIALKMDKTRSQIWKREKSLQISSYFAIKKVICYLVK